MSDLVNQIEYKERPILNPEIKVELNRILKICQDVVRVKTLYLFGSFAYGKPRIDSDFDFLLITSAKNIRSSLVEEKLKKTIKAAGLNRIVHIFVLTENEFKRRLILPLIERIIYGKGLILFGGADYKDYLTNYPNDKKIKKAKKLAEAIFRRTSITFYNAEKAHYQYKDIVTANYFCQVAVKNILRCFLAWHNLYFENMRTVTNYMEACLKVDPSLKGKFKDLSFLKIHKDYKSLMLNPVEILKLTKEELEIEEKYFPRLYEEAAKLAIFMNDYLRFEGIDYVARLIQPDGAKRFYILRPMHGGRRRSL